MLFIGLQFFLFLIIIRPQDFASWLLGAPIVFIVMGCLLAGWLLSTIDKNIFRTPIDKYFALFFALFVISTINVGWLNYTAAMARETIKIALIYWFTVSIVTNAERLKAATWTTVILMTVVAIMGIFQFYGYDITGNGMTWAPDKHVWQIKGAGLFDNPNDLAYSVVLIVPFAVGLFIVSDTQLTKLCAIVMLFIAMYCIYLTNSRGGYLATCMACITWFYFWISSQSLRRVAFVIGLIGVFVSFGIQTSNYREDKSAMGRVEAWAEGMNMLREHPLIGVGKGQFIEHHERDSHSSYVRAGAELGIIGLFAFIGILYSAISFLISEEQIATADWRLYKIGFISYISSFCVASLFSTRTYDIIFMIIAALISSLNRLSVNMKAKDNTSNTLLMDVILNSKVIILTLFTLIVWKIFLIQVW
jgi:O-antigen ligase